MKKLNKIIISVSVFMFLTVLVLYFINLRQKAALPQPSEQSTTPSQSNLPSQENSDSASSESNATSPSQTSNISNGSTIALEDKLKNIPLPGKQTDDSSILNKYGKFAFETLAKNPNITTLIKGLDNNFDPSMVDVSSPSHTFQLTNGKNYLAFSGCATGNCGGTEKIILFNEAENKVFMAAENESQTQFNLFGNPDDQEKSLLLYVYFHK